MMTNSIGFKNQATALVALWIDNDKALYDHFQEVAKDTTTAELCDKMMDYFDELRHDVGLEGVLSDLLTDALFNVDFYEVAERFKGE